MSLRRRLTNGSAACHSPRHDRACRQLSLTGFDPNHADDEDRYLTMGLSAVGRLLLVSHTDRGEKVLIVSARKKNRRERRDYEDCNFPYETESADDELRPEYDFRSMRGVVRGKYAARYRERLRLVRLVRVCCLRVCKRSGGQRRLV